jgi:ATP-dependent DNA ligase
MAAIPFGPPVAPMLARLSRELPTGDLVYEPKWDGFRCLAFASAGGPVDLRSRHQRPLARYFPELVEALAALPRAAAIDGEIVVAGPRGLDFAALLARVHPSPSRVERLRRETPAALIAFDLLADGDEDLRGRAFAERRARLEALFGGVRPPLHLTPATSDRAVARAWLDRYHGGGIDGVVAKRRDLAYAPGRRALVKVKRERTAECVVGGLRTFSGQPVVASLLLGLWDAGELRHVGSIIAPYSLRAAATPLVAAPLRWDEVEAAAAGDDERLRLAPGEVIARFERGGDLFAPALGPGPPLPDAR